MTLDYINELFEKYPIRLIYQRQPDEFNRYNAYDLKKAYGSVSVKYDVDFPMYTIIDELIEDVHSINPRGEYLLEALQFHSL